MTPARKLARRARVAFDRAWLTGDTKPIAGIRREIATAWLAAHADRDGAELFWLNAAAATLETMDDAEDGTLTARRPVGSGS